MTQENKPQITAEVKNLIGYTTKCCICGALATNWQGYLIKSRDKVGAGFCEEHKKRGSLGGKFKGYYDKGFEFSEIKPENVIEIFGLNKNLNE